MKKYILFTISLCLSIFSFQLDAQNQLEVTVFDDLNANGLDDGEPTIDGITTLELQLFQDVNSNGVVDVGDVEFLHDGGLGGLYTFGAGSLLLDGNYILLYNETPGPGAGIYHVTQMVNGVGAVDLDNDMDPTTNFITFDLTGVGTQMNIDLGLYLAASIGDMVFEDLNGNGINNAEPGIDGVMVTLLDDTGVAITMDANGPIPANPVLTAGGGMYLFEELIPGDYIVEFSIPATTGPNPWYVTTVSIDTDAADPGNDSDADPDDNLRSHIIELTSDEMEDRIDAGFWEPVTVSDFVFCDENGDGIYDPVTEGFVRSIDVRLVDAGTMVPIDDADGNPYAENTAGDGMYMFELVPPGNYILQFLSLPGNYRWTRIDQGGDDCFDSDVNDATGETNNFMVTSQTANNSDLDCYDAGAYQLMTITGNVWLDMGDNSTYDGEGGPDNVEVQLFLNGSLVDTDNTAGGFYEFLDVVPGDYEIIIPASNFIEGSGALFGVNSCEIDGGQADDTVDNDDNGQGSDTDVDISTGQFRLRSNCEDDGITIEYIDFCFYFDCDAENPLADIDCNNASIICNIEDLSGFCSRMPVASTGNGPSPLCPTGGAPHNISWFAFVAPEGTYDITFSPFGCTDAGGGNQGVQLGVYTDCSFSESVVCNAGCTTNPISISSADLNPGQTYYFFIDGCAGSVCSYTAEIDGVFNTPVFDPSDMCINDNGTLICDDASYCPDTDVLFEVQDLEAMLDYYWEITEISGAPFVGDLNPITEENNLTLSFPEEGVYEICFDRAVGECNNTSINSPYCRTITIAAIAPEEFDLVEICEDDLDSFDPSVLEDSDAPNPMDPNGDGNIGWLDPSPTFDFGTNMYTYTDPSNGCMHEQEFELMAYPDSDVGMFSTIICNEDLPLNLPGVPEITDVAFGGDLILDLPDVTLTGVENQFGCDSVVNVMIERLSIFDGELTAPRCEDDGIFLLFTFDLSLSTDPDLYTFQWLDPSGNPLSDDYNDPATVDPQWDNVAPTGVNGEYTLIVTIEKDGVMCDFMYTVDIDFADFLPMNITLQGPDLTLCEADSVQTYSVIDFGDAFNFIWNITNAEVISGGGLNDEMVEVNWAGTTSGTIAVTPVNICGEGSPVNFDVTIIPLLTPDFDFTAVVCEDSIAVIEFTGDQSVVDSYTWDFGGGVIDNGADPNSGGPFDIVWSDANSDKTVTLSVMHNGACQSEVTTNIVTLVEPLTAPVVTCNPTTGEVTFTWPDVPGATGYDINVTSLDGNSNPHNGTLDLANNSYTVGGLDDGETVSIELIVMTGDACVMVLSQATPCTSQNCVAPTIDLMSSEIEFCLDENTGTVNIVPTITSGETGVGTFSGNGIIDPDNGVFDPDSAMIGQNIVTYNFTTDDDCIGVQTIAITVFETPVASFANDLDTICITESIQLTYDGSTGVNEINWTTDDGQSFNGMTPTVSFATEGEKTISLQVIRDGCESEMIERVVFVQPTLAAIDVTCLRQEIDLVEFTWDAIAGATEYIVTVTNADGSVDPPFSTTSTTHLIGGLNPDDVISITVEVVTDSRCPGSNDTQDCQAVACPTFTFDYGGNEVIDRCVPTDGSAALIDLTAVASGGDNSGVYNWTASAGSIVNDTQFDPNGVAEGQIDLIVTYTEGGCEETGNVTINITHIPEASFTMDPANICVGSTIPITFTGSQLPGQTIDWSASDETVTITATANPNEYEATFDSAGIYTVMLEVENGVCTTSPAMASITVEPELEFEDIDCAPGPDAISYSWDAVDCASEYEVFVNEVSQGMQSGTDFEVTGLANEEEVTIRVVAISDCACGSVENTRTCMTMPCLQVDLTVSAMGGETDFCLTSDLTPVEVLAELEGESGLGAGSWSGTGVDANGIFDPMTAGVGTHTILYTFIEPEGCEEFMDSVTFNIFEMPAVEAMADEISCYDDSLTMLTITPMNGDGTYTINVNNIVSDTISEVGEGTYDILVTDGNGCTAETSQSVSIPNEPMPSIDGLDALIVGQTSDYSINQSIFTGLAIDSVVWTANGTVLCDDPACFSTGAQAPTENTTYTVTVFYNNGCSVTRSIDVEVTEPEPIYTVDIPNIISPNGDGANDEWQIFTGDPNVVINNVRILDRWGNLVFENIGAYKPTETIVTWDGRFGTSDMQPGVYVYMVEYIQDERVRTRTGDVTIIR